MTDVQSYSGGCHCGRVRFDVSLALDSVIACNCSICQKAGYWLAFVPGSAFRLRSGDDALTDYQFNKKTIHHVFCQTCGIHAFARGSAPDGSEVFAVNVRCLDGADLTRINPTAFDGRSL
ncbi:MAG: GFA family protein [Hyphomicrobium sp.]